MTKPHKRSGATSPPAKSLADELADLVRAEQSDPFRVLGPHRFERDGKKMLAIRAFRPVARERSVLWNPGQTAYPSVQIHPAGVFEANIAASQLGLSDGAPVAPPASPLRFRFADGLEFETYDAFPFRPILSDYDLYLSG